MKAAVYTQYGGPEVVQIKEIAKPAPGPKEILVKVKASSLTAGDWRMRAGNPFPIRLYNGLFKIKRSVLGQEFSGEIVALGAEVKEFNIGDAIAGSTGQRAGAHAQYVCIPPDAAIALKPKNISHEEAAALPVGALTANYFLQLGGLSKGQKVLIYGASGSVGSYALQLAKHFGAEVTAVCSAANARMVADLGADHHIDYRKQDYGTLEEQFDIVFDTVGKSSYKQALKVLKPSGKYLSVAMSLKLMRQSISAKLFGRPEIFSTVTKSKVADLKFLLSLVAHGDLKVVIDEKYPLSEIQAAHQKAENGHKRGNLVLIPN